MKSDPVLVPFGPTVEVPAGHRWCFACNGHGREEDKPCQVCQGKGYWNAEDIKLYHERNPQVCRKSCGERHVAPVFGQELRTEFLEYIATLPGDWEVINCLPGGWKVMV